MKTLLAVMLMLLATTAPWSEVFTGEKLNEPFTIHGRLSCYNGGSTFRIWIIGSKRMLYVPFDSTCTPALERVNKLFGDGGGWFTREIYADFTVEPLETDIKGYMRPIRILAIKRIVITRDGEVIAKRDEL